MLLKKTVMTLRKYYFAIEEVHNIEIPHKNKSLFLSHTNPRSLNRNFDDLQHLLGYTKNVF